MKTKLLLTAFALALINLAMRSPDFYQFYLVLVVPIFGAIVHGLFGQVEANYLNKGR